jgi:hypothetical protein
MSKPYRAEKLLDGGTRAVNFGSANNAEIRPPEAFQKPHQGAWS